MERNLDGEKPLSNDALRSLIAFAAARSYSANTNNPLNAILPLFEPIAAALHGRLFTAADLSRELRDRYDLIVSDELCTHWSNQLIQQKLLVPVSTTTGSGGYEWSQERVANAQDGAFAEEMNELLSELRTFATDSGDLITGSYTDDQLVRLLRRGAIASMFPRLHENNNPHHGSEDEYVFSRFVSSLSVGNARILDNISRLRRAAIYSDLILHLREPKKPGGNSQYVHAYLDSPLVMDLLGLGGKLRKQFATRLFESLKAQKVIFLVSPVMIDEVKGNIRALISRDPRDRFGPTADALRRGEFKIDYVEACHDRIEALVEASGLQIDHNFNTYLIDKLDDAGKSLESELLSRLQSHYRMFGAAERDAKSLIGCLGRRGGSKPRDMYSSRSFFVTSNDMLAAVGNKFFRENCAYKDSTFPVVVTRSTIAAMADAIAGISSNNSMTEMEMIVSAADATSYNPAVFEQIERILKELTPSDAKDLSEILQRTDVSELAMDLVRGNPNNVTIQRVSEIADIVQNRLEIEAHNRVAAGIEKERTAAKIQMERLAAAIAEKEQKIAALSERRIARHESSTGSLARYNKLLRKISSKSKSINVVLAIAVAATVGIATYMLSLYADSISQNVKIILSIITATAGGIPLIGFGPIKTAINQTIERRLSDLLNKKASELGYELNYECLPSNTELKATLSHQLSAEISNFPPDLPTNELFPT
jgi:hypothetical protein